MRASIVLYCDNCTGQNKNQCLLHFAVLLVELGAFARVKLNFLVKGHTKNACDRGFGQLKQKYTRSDSWSLDQLQIAVASPTRDVKLLSGSPFFYLRAVIQERYRPISGIQKFIL